MSVRMLALVPVLALLAHAPLEAQLRSPGRLDKLEDRARADSNDAMAHYNLGLGYWSAGRLDEAERSFQLASEIDPRLAEAYLAQATLPFARRPQLLEEAATGRVPAQWVAVLEESNQLYWRAVYFSPLVDLKTVAALTPADSIDWDVPADELVYVQAFQECSDQVLRDKYNGARKAFRNLVKDMGWRDQPELIPDQILWYWGLFAAHAGEWDEAFTNLTALTERPARSGGSYAPLDVTLDANQRLYVLAALKHEAGLFDEATQLLREVLAREPGFHMAHVRLARMHEARGEWIQAAEELRSALRADPDDRTALYDLGVTLGRAGHFGESEQLLLQAQHANPRDARVPYVLGLVQLSWGRYQEARDSFERFLSLAPSGMEEQIADAERRLASYPERP